MIRNETWGKRNCLTASKSIQNGQTQTLEKSRRYLVLEGASKSIVPYVSDTSSAESIMRWGEIKTGINILMYLIVYVFLVCVCGGGGYFITRKTATIFWIMRSIWIYWKREMYCYIFNRFAKCMQRYNVYHTVYAYCFSMPELHNF